MKIVTAAQMREIDRLSTEKYGISGLTLMENAGARVVEVLENRFGDFDEMTFGILCGKGNNGGDGFVVARLLIEKGVRPVVLLFAAESDLRGDAKVNFIKLKEMGHAPISILSVEQWAVARGTLTDADVIIDALLGTGITKPVDGLYKLVVETEFSGATIVSIDIPSGLPADAAESSGPSFKADLTIALSAPKPSLVLSPNQERVGDVVVADIGNPRALLESDGLNLNLIQPEDFPASRIHRSPDTNKGTFGKVLIIGGSRGKSGAAAMAGRAALRAGAGLVTVATSRSVVDIIAGSMPELMTEALEETTEGGIANQSISRILEGKTVVAVGPGMGTVPETSAFVRGIVKSAPRPLILDADGLNAFVGHQNEMRDVIITPHPGEMARLTGKPVNDRVSTAREFAVGHDAYVVLKGFRTVVACPDGSVYINPTGNPGMATAGTGDILTGLIAGTLAQQNLGSLVERLCLAVYLHGLAGDFAADTLGEEVMVATDILNFLPNAWRDLRERSKVPRNFRHISPFHPARG